MGLYTITTRATGTVLTGAGSSSNIWNVDHVNHVTHTEPASINSYEATVAQMQIETPPTTNGVLSLAAALSGEIERLRATYTAIKTAISSGTPPAHWYTPTGTFSEFVSLPPVATRKENAGVASIDTGHNVTMLWDTTTYDTTGTSMSSASQGLIAPVTGNYLVGATLSFGNALTTGPTKDFRLTLLRADNIANVVVGVGALLASSNVWSSTTSRPKAITIETVAHFAVNQVLGVQIFQNSGSAQTVSVANGLPAVWMALIGR